MRQNYFFSKNSNALLEPYEGKLSCTVLRGESSSNGADLLDKLLDYPWFENYRNLILLSIICIIFLKNLLIVWLSKMQVGYINKLYSCYSEKLYDNYYRQGLLFIKDRLSDELTYNTNAVSYLFTHGVLSLTFSIIAEVFLLLFIWCGIFWFSPLAAYGICVCLIPFGVIYFYWVRKKLRTYGKEKTTPNAV